MPPNSQNQNPSSESKLASILFADIAGYTALMQRHNAAATTLLRKFQKEIQSKVKAFKGSIVNEMGDEIRWHF